MRKHSLYFSITLLLIMAICALFFFIKKADTPLQNPLQALNLKLTPISSTKGPSSEALSEASHAYEQLHAQLTKASYSSETVLQAQALVQRYPNTPYASFALLHLARQAVYEQKLTEAIDWLMQCIEQSQDVELKLIALQRATRVLIANHQEQQALELLNHPICHSSPLICQHIKGDLLITLGQWQEAQAAYQIAAQPPANILLAFDKMNAIIEP